MPDKKDKVKKTVVKKTSFEPNQKMFALEIALLDKLQNEIFEAIAQKPNAMDYDEVRLFVDNVFMTLNKSSQLAKDVKNLLLKKDFKESITETYNPPA